MKKYKITIIIIFFVILVIPIVFVNLKENQISEIDNTKLLDLSDIDSVSEFENYLEKRIGFRSEIINIYNIMNDKLFHEMKHPTYEYGKDDFVFFKMKNEKDDYEYLDTYANLIKNMQDYVTKRGSYFIIVLNPPKVETYSEYLPEGYHFNNIRMNYLKNKFEELGINYLDNSEILSEKKKEIMVFNKQYDAGHWNEYGAFYSIKNLYSTIIKDGVKISNINFDDYNITQKLETKLPVSEYPISEYVPQFSLKNVDYKIKEIKNIDINATYGYKAKTTNDKKEKRVLLFRGSYFGGKEKFVANNFKEVFFISNYYNAIDFDYYYNLSDYPDIVIMDAVEYSIGESYYPSYLIDEKEYNIKYSTIKSLPNKKFTEIKIDTSISIADDEMLTIRFNNKDVKYAYLVVDNMTYDFSKHGDDFKISLFYTKKNKGKKKIVVVNNDMDKKYEIDIF